MGLPQALSTPEMDASNNNLPYPAQTKQVAGEVKGVLTDVMVVSFSDKIMVTIMQNGRLAQWINVPLFNDNPIDPDSHFVGNSAGDDSLLPSSRFTAQNLLGAGGSDRETLGHLYASQIANAITTKTPSETRALTLGLGLNKVEKDRDVFLQIIDLVLQCI